MIANTGNQVSINVLLIEMAVTKRTADERVNKRSDRTFLRIPSPFRLYYSPVHGQTEQTQTRIRNNAVGMVNSSGCSTSTIIMEYS